MKEADFEALEDNQVLVQVGRQCTQWPVGQEELHMARVAAVREVGSRALSLLCRCVLCLTQDFHPVLLPQGMLANRFMATFREDITGWHRRLNAVADVVQLLAEIQRSWACELGSVLGRHACRL